MHSSVPISQISPETSPDTKKSQSKIKWINLLFLTLTPLVSAGCLYMIWPGLDSAHIALFVICYSISNLAITVGYHRYFAHRSFRVHSFLEWLFVLVGAGSFQGSALQWSTDHRRHHRKVDSDEDPYSITKGFWHAHIGWLLRHDTHPLSRQFPRDLLESAAVRFQHKFYVPIALGVGFLLPAFAGWALGLGFFPSLIVGGLVRTVLSQHSTFLINSAAHAFGSQPYTDTNSARDSFWLAVLTFGEGYHNFHHIFQSDYRNGVRWYHWDPSKWIIGGLKLTGLASRLVKVPEKEILRARLEMQLKSAASRGANFERLIALRDRIQVAHAQFLTLRHEFRNEFRNEMKTAQEKAHRAYHEKVAELELAQAELRGAIGAWNAYVQNWCRLAPVRA